MNWDDLRTTIRCKIKGDAGTYEVWAIDWLNLRVMANRDCGTEWVPMSKLKIEETKAVEAVFINHS